MDTNLSGGVSHISLTAGRDEKPFRTRPGAVDYLAERWGVRRSVATLAKLACVGGGPAFMKAGRTPLYRDADLDVWVKSLLRPAGKGA